MWVLGEFLLIDDILKMVNKRKSKLSQKFTTENQPARDASATLLPSPPLTPSSPLERLSMLPSRARFLIASLGNPGDLRNTRHSAGHILLSALALSMQAAVPKRQGTVFTSSFSPQYSFFQCPTLMNVSGPAIVKAYQRFVHEQMAEEQNTTVGLFVLHDDLDTKLGQLSVRRGQASARGQKGIKSVLTSITGAASLRGKGIDMVRVGIGIGRPAGRTMDEVVPYVMAKVSHEEREAIEECVGEVRQLLDEDVRKIEEAQ